eukprot:1146823-Pelagomonas_calceolata.AAC.3
MGMSTGQPNRLAVADSGYLQEMRHSSICAYVSNFLLQRNWKLFYFMSELSELLDLLLAGMDQPQADQPNILAGGLPV